MLGSSETAQGRSVDLIFDCVGGDCRRSSWNDKRAERLFLLLRFTIGERRPLPVHWQRRSEAWCGATPTLTKLIDDGAVKLPK
jgi:hypothetical protein